MLFREKYLKIRIQFRQHVPRSSRSYILLLLLEIGEIIKEFINPVKFNRGPHKHKLEQRLWRFPFDER